MKNYISIGLLGFLSLFMIGVACAVDLSSCGTITASGEYTLNTSISAGENCLMIQADNVTIDGKGIYSITGSVNARGYNNLFLNNVVVYGIIDISPYDGYDMMPSGNISITNSSVYGMMIMSIGQHCAMDYTLCHGGGNGGMVNVYNSNVYGYIIADGGNIGAGTGMSGAGGIVNIFFSNVSGITVQAGSADNTTNINAGGTINIYMPSTYTDMSFFGNPMGASNIILPCTENWMPQLSPSTCKTGTQLLTYYDANDCGTNTDLPSNNGTTQTCCFENWIQYLYPSKCSTGTQQILYYDRNSCNTAYFLPSNNGTTQDCNVCTENWQRTVTPTTCLNGTQLVTYSDLNKCGTTDYLPLDNGTTISCCVEDWIMNYGICIKNKQIIWYTDFNDCGTYVYFPHNNDSIRKCRVNP